VLEEESLRVRREEFDSSKLVGTSLWRGVDIGISITVDLFG
jgi:hypothetical protein